MGLDYFLQNIPSRTLDVEEDDNAEKVVFGDHTNKQNSMKNKPVIEDLRCLAGETSNLKIPQRIDYQHLASYNAHSKKAKIAPRSSLQFKLGPPFGEQIEHTQVYAMSCEKPVKPILTSRIDRGFDNINNTWIGYKRNYFTSVASFQICSDQRMSLDKFMQDRFYIKINSKRVEIQYFATRLVAFCCEDSKEMELVQHTAKRDKGPQYKPPIHPIILGELPSHEIIRDASNIKNDSKKKKYDSNFFLHRDNIDCSFFDPNCILLKYPLKDIIKVARYERVQFSSSINQKRPLNTIKHFKLTTVLGAVIKGNMMSYKGCNNIKGATILLENNQTFIPLVSKSTPALIIRGRSPSNYPSGILEYDELSNVVTKNDDKLKKKIPKITDQSIIIENPYNPKLHSNGVIKNFDQELRINNFEILSNENIDWRSGYGRNKHSSIKRSNKLKNPPLLISSRPTTSNSPSKKLKLVTSDYKNDDIIKPHLKQTNAECNKESVLNNSQDIIELEHLLMEQLLKDDYQFNQKNLLKSKAFEDLKICKSKQNEYNLIDSSLNASQTNLFYNRSFSQELIDQNIESKENLFETAGLLSYLEEKNYNHNISRNSKNPLKRVSSESFFSPLILLPNQQSNKKQKTLSSNPQIVRLIPHNEFNEFLNSEKSGEDPQGSELDNNQAVLNDQAHMYELLDFSSDRCLNNISDDNIVLETALNILKNPANQENVTDNIKSRKRYEFVSNKKTSASSVDDDIKRIPRCLLSRDTIDYLNESSSNILSSNLFLDEELYEEEKLTQGQEKDTSNGSFLLV